MLLSGIRKEEGIRSFNLMVSLGKRFNEEYYNESTGFLEHFRYPKLFLRNSKNLYVSAVPNTLLTEIATSGKVSYNMVRKRLLKNGLRLRIKELRSFYATNMRELGLLSEQIDLAQGRIGKNIFLQHYFKQNPRTSSDKILSLLPKLESLIS
jgi:intergrase/recombinase